MSKYVMICTCIIHSFVCMNHPNYHSADFCTKYIYVRASTIFVHASYVEYFVYLKKQKQAFNI